MAATEVKAEVPLLQLLLQLLLLLLLHLLLQPLLLRVEGMAPTTLHPPLHRYLAVAAAVESREAGHGRARITMSSSACLATSQRMN